ncbi:hypothetical protein M444_35040 (plasmid) [Streptomyces sp. Mg1]|nr:hypothetical protein M444_35040 [Streptomyces sp. Mg1]
MVQSRMRNRSGRGTEVGRVREVDRPFHSLPPSAPASAQTTPNQGGPAAEARVRPCCPHTRRPLARRPNWSAAYCWVASIRSMVAGAGPRTGGSHLWETAAASLDTSSVARAATCSR